MSHSIKFFLLACVFLCACKTSDEGDLSLMPDNLEFEIQGADILRSGLPIRLNGVNTLHVFGPADAAQYELLKNWGVQAVRIFIGNLREQPLSGAAIQDTRGDWLHPLQTIVDRNRSNGLMSILCPFGWVNNEGERTLFTGLNPSEQVFYTDYKSRMRDLATQFKDQEDVFIEVWNEPYSYQRANGYSHSLWLSDMEDMVDNLRSVRDFHNIILVPGNGQGQSEEAIHVQGNKLKNGRYNLLFDLHAYEQWLLNTNAVELRNRLNSLKNNEFAVVFGEVGVINTSGLMDVSAFLNTALSLEVSVMGWVWKMDGGDQNALLDDSGAPNNLNNNNWGTTFNAFLSND